ncbi:carotenoid cleavage dioxygenase 7, chloroplastic [Olea europaea subsp. europaea]|uniref:Carotenoid cleavage dioxygenase 7, chloroplastic n=1 Tax=Olea europaea subsp. europaea TaxID=158383 RepID=A0A8S0PKS1_OLEEU|nr:carotenoid cleavage dioxygenase 7, chloroplastic [Olea europaea subsp. europaea]
MIHDWAFTDSHYILFGNRIKLDIAGYDWRSGKLDPSMMNLEQGQEKLLPHLIEVSINLEQNGNCHKCCVNDLNQWNKATDFPAINQDFSGGKNTYVYASTTSGLRQALPNFQFDTVVNLNTIDKSLHSTWSTRRRRFIDEPIFIPKGGEEDDGYLFVVEYAVSTQRCYFIILDSKLIGEKNALVARFEVPRHLNFPLGFHGFWAPR